MAGESGNKEKVPKSLLQAEDGAFPRGGGSVLTPIEIKQAANEATKDVLFGAPQKDESAGKKRKRKPQRKQEKAAEKKEGPKKLRIESLGFKNAVPGTVVLGQISEVNSLDLAVSLPNNLTGYVPITNISKHLSQLLESVEKAAENDSDDEEEIDLPELTDLFKVGQWVRAAVVASGVEEPQKKNQKAKKRIELSIDPVVVNEKLDSDDLKPGMAVQGAVNSVEDHGAIMSIGASDEVTGFVSKKELHRAGIQTDELRKGQVLLLTVLSRSSNGRTLTLTASPLDRKVPVVAALSSSSSLTAGMLVETIITEVRSTGVVGKVFEFAEGTADQIHSGLLESGKKDMESLYKVGDTVKARVIFTYPDSDPLKVALSFLPHVVGLSTSSESPLAKLPVGSIVDAKIELVEPKSGLYVTVGGKKHGFVHISRVSSEERIEELSAASKDYSSGTVHKARVLGFANTDGLYVLSLEKAILEQKYLRAQDVPIGDVVSCKVERIMAQGGIIVKLSEGLEAIADEKHLSDIKLSHPERKFKPGMKVKCRVLSVSDRKIKVTLKKSLVNSEDKLITCWDDAEVGMRTPGVIAILKPRGAIVEFFGGIKGYLPVSEISEAFVKDPKDHLSLGQSIAVYVRSVEPEEQRMLVSCRSPANDTTRALEELIPGQAVVSAVVTEKTKDGVIVTVEPHGVKGVLPAGHITDESNVKNKKGLKDIKVGSKLENLVVLEKDKGKKFVTLSGKKSLVEAVQQNGLPAQLSEIRTGDVLHGFIKNITIKGLFIAFANNLVGLALKHDLLEEKALDDPSTKYNIFQSVTCRVLDVDEAHQRFQLTLKLDKEKKADKQQQGDNDCVNPVDPTIKSLADYTPGRVTKAKILAIKDTQINVVLADNRQGRIDVSEAFDSFDNIKDPINPLQSSFEKGQILDVKVIGYHDARNHRYLPISHRSSTYITVELSCKKSDLKSSKPYSTLTYDNVKVGTEWLTFINNVTHECAWVNLSPTVRGRIPLLDLSSDARDLKDFAQNFPIGRAVKAQVVESGASDILKLSARKAAGTHIKDISDIKEGMKVPGIVVKVAENRVVVRIGDNVLGTAGLTDLVDEYIEEPTENFANHELVPVQVIKVDKPNKRVYVSLRDSLFDSDAEVVDKLVTSAKDVAVGDVIRGYVLNVADSGLFVGLGRDITARVQIKNLSDAYLTDWKKYFSVNQLVEGKILNIRKDGKIDMTLKESAVRGITTTKSGKGISELEKGEILDGVVKRIESFGVFIRLDGTTNVSGLCHRSEVADIPVADLSKVFAEGDKVKVKVLDIDTEKKRVSLGMKSAYFDDGAEDSGMDIDEDDEEEEEESDDDMADALGDDSDSESDEESSDEEEQPARPAKTTEGGLSVGFDWTGSALDQTEAIEAQSESESDEENEPSRKRRKKKAQTLVEDKTASIATKTPETPQDFERLLMGSPNSSIVWMQYMSFQARLSEIDRAREIAERALKTIDFREEQEKFNIWMALLNLETAFGTEETFEDVLKRALQHNDPKVTYLRLVDSLEASGRADKAEKHFYVAAKKFGAEDLTVYERFCAFLFRHGKNATARDILSRALQALPKNEHRMMISKFAQLEYANGEAEQGRTLFEGLISSYPKRVDLWSVYLDHEMKYNDRASVERLFERLVSGKEVKLNMKKAKFFFKKWLGYEDTNGDDKSRDYVKAKAAQFVESLKGDDE
ncbi:rRNA biogenesis protein Rrp5p [Trichomonascus vanleenenianus]|uniref:Rrp5p n=1 Tax=Trichomonascus vanleenenianus TaxID=2268995 RepID=UPI003EC9BC9E